MINQQRQLITALPINPWYWAGLLLTTRGFMAGRRQQM
jgi:hypothetical protein